MDDLDYKSLMNAKELVPITVDWSQPIVKSTLIGFKGLGEENGITAAYEVARVVGNEIQFVLGYDEYERRIIDNTWFGSNHLYINKEPIIIDKEIVRLNRKAKLENLK